MPSKISFIIKSELYKSDKKIKFNKNHVKELTDNIKSYSRCNSQNEIFSYKLGVINLYETIVTPLLNDDFLYFEFNVDLNVNTINEAEEIIWCIFEPAYSLDGIVNFTIEGLMKRQYYTMKIINTPIDINITNNIVNYNV